MMFTRETPRRAPPTVTFDRLSATLSKDDTSVSMNSTTARPIPPSPPVTTATRPVNRIRTFLNFNDAVVFRESRSDRCLA